MRFQRTLKVETRIPSVSMADIAFLLFIFFMSTTIFRLEEGLLITLPRAEMGEPMPRERVTHIWIDAEGTVSIDDRLVRMEDLVPILQAKVRANPSIIVGINCDENAPYSFMARTIDAMKTAGVLPFYSAWPGNGHGPDCHARAGCLPHRSTRAIRDSWPLGSPSRSSVTCSICSWGGGRPRGRTRCASARSR
jgi:biopolymer transport protein ExbD